MKAKTVIVLALLISVTLMLSTEICFAGEKSFGQKAKNFWRKLIGYPSRLTKETGDVICDTTKNTTDTVSNTAKNTTDVLSGKLESIDDLVVDPVKDTTMTVGVAAKEVVEAPIEAVKEPESSEAAE